MSQTTSGSKVDIKTLITTGIFTALYFVLLAIGGIAGILSPFMMFAGPLISILLAGPVIVLFLRRVRTFGMLPILGFIIGLLIFMGGHVWYSILVAPITAVLGDLIARSGRYASRWLNALAYAVFSLWNITPLTPILYDTEGFLHHVSTKLGADFAAQFAQIFTPFGMLIFAICVFVVALLSGWFGALLVNKHFQNA